MLAATEWVAAGLVGPSPQAVDLIAAVNGGLVRLSDPWEVMSARPGSYRAARAAEVKMVGRCRAGCWATRDRLDRLSMGVSERRWRRLVGESAIRESNAPVLPSGAGGLLPLGVSQTRR